MITATHSETLQSDITLSQTHRPQTYWPESTQVETQQETVQQTPSPTPIASSMPPWTTSAAPVSSSSESQPPLLGQSHANAYTSESDPGPLATTLPTLSSSLMTTHSVPASSESRGTPGLQVVTSTQRGTSTQSSTAVSTSSSDSPTSSPLTGVVSGPTDSSEAASGSQKSSSHKVGAIVGGAVGGAVFIILALLACFLFRRRRRNTLHRRQLSRQKILRSDSENSANAFLHNRQLSWPTMQSSAIPSAPLLPPQRNYSHPDTWLNPALVTSNQDLSLDRMYLHNEHQQHFTDDPFSDPENGPIIEVSPPTRSASIYSRSSWDGGLKFLELYDSSRSSPGGSTYYPGESTATLPGPGDDTPNSQKLATPKRRASIRSNPFDLEAPPSAVSRGQVPRLPPGPPNPAWGRWH